MIVILTLIFLAVIVSTQFSFGTLFAALTPRGRAAAARSAWKSFHEWREERRCEQQRREVIAKHTQEGAPLAPSPPRHRRSARQERREVQLKRPKAGRRRARTRRTRTRNACVAERSRRRPSRQPRRSRRRSRRKVSMPAPHAAAVRSGTDDEGAGRAPQGRLRAAAARAARRAEDRAQDRRARADGRRAAARREVPRILGRRQRGADSSRARWSRRSSSSRTPA